MNTKNLFTYISCIIIISLVLTSCSVLDIRHVQTSEPKMETNIPTSTTTSIKTTPTSVDADNKNPTSTIALSSTKTSSTVTETEMFPISTATILPVSKTDDQLKKNNTYIIIRDLSGPILLVYIESGNTKVLLRDLKERVKNFVIGKDGCDVLVSLSNQRVITLDLSGRIIKEILPANWYKGDGVIGSIDLSPSEDWIAYVLGYGKANYDSFEKQEIVIKNYINGQEIKLTKNGGGWVDSWSPDGTSIAYSDFDENGINQLYVVQLNNFKKTKITSFSDNDKKVISLAWSPNNNDIAFRLFSAASSTESVGIVTSIYNYKKLNMYQPTYNISAIWWQDTDILAIKSKGHSMDVITWINPNTLETVNTLNSSQIGNVPILSTKNYDTTLVGFFSDQYFYTYNLMTKDLRKLFLSYYSPEDWKFSPIMFKNPNQCE